MTPVEFHSEALLELEEAHAWYKELDELVATAFLAEINRSVAKISERPESWPKTRDNERRFLLNQFPYSVIYRVLNNVVFVTAFAHHRRRPHYWRERE